MGFTPQEIGEMSIWQYATAVDGYTQSHVPDDKGLSQAEADDLAAIVLAMQ